MKKLIEKIEFLSEEMDKAMPSGPGTHFYDEAKYDRLRVRHDLLMEELSLMQDGVSFAQTGEGNPGTDHDPNGPSFELVVKGIRQVPQDEWHGRCRAIMDWYGLSQPEPAKGEPSEPEPDTEPDQWYHVEPACN